VLDPEGCWVRPGGLLRWSCVAGDLPGVAGTGLPTPAELPRFQGNRGGMTAPLSGSAGPDVSTVKKLWISLWTFNSSQLLASFNSLQLLTPGVSSSHIAGWSGAMVGWPGEEGHQPVCGFGPTHPPLFGFAVQPACRGPCQTRVASQFLFGRDAVWWAVVLLKPTDNWCCLQCFTGPAAPESLVICDGDAPTVL